MTSHSDGECVPAEGAEDGSLHWLMSDGWGPLVSIWRDETWIHGGYTFTVHELDAAAYHYIGPASPTEAADLAAARAEIVRWQNKWSDERDRADNNQQDLEERTNKLAAACKERDEQIEALGRRMSLAISKAPSDEYPSLTCATIAIELAEATQKGNVQVCRDIRDGYGASLSAEEEAAFAAADNCVKAIASMPLPIGPAQQEEG
jgi:hypothetical protein